MWKKLDDLLREHRFIVGVALLAVVVIGALLATERVLLAMIPEEGGGLVRDRLGFWVNVITEVFGIGITVVIIERFNRRREDKRRIAEKKQEEQRQYEETIKRIFREIRNANSQDGIRAVEEARDMGVLMDGTLRKTDLNDANLSGARIHEADLSYVNLMNSNLSEARMHQTDLSHANLSGANLRGANLKYANLINTNLRGATFDKSTMLPDRTYWTPYIDIIRYTDPHFPDFWMTHFVAAGFEKLKEWDSAGNPQPWAFAGYGGEEWNEWVRDGKPGPWQALEIETWQEWYTADKPRPWGDAGYGRDEWNVWVRDGRPDPEKSIKLGRIPFWKATDFDTREIWLNNGRPRPWVDAGYGDSEWNEWVHDGKPGPWQALEIETWQQWFAVSKPRPWTSAGYLPDQWDVWIIDGKPSDSSFIRSESSFDDFEFESVEFDETHGSDGPFSIEFQFDLPGTNEFTKYPPTDNTDA